MDGTVLQSNLGLAGQSDDVLSARGDVPVAEKAGLLSPEDDSFCVVQLVPGRVACGVYLFDVSVAVVAVYILIEPMVYSFVFFGC